MGTRRPLSPDTTPEAEELLLTGYRAMSPEEKLRRIFDLNRLAEEVAAERIRSQYGPDLSARELQLRLAALRIDRETMIRAFGWDPEVEGY